MIIGLGTDIVNIDRIARLLEKAGDRFKERTFTKQEIEAAGRYNKDNQAVISAHFAKRFAAKEAFAKAVGTGFGKNINFVDVGVGNDVAGKPLLILSERAVDLVKTLAGGRDFACHVSISDDFPYAVATVIIEITAVT